MSWLLFLVGLSVGASIGLMLGCILAVASQDAVEEREWRARSHPVASLGETPWPPPRPPRSP